MEFQHWEAEAEAEAGFPSLGQPELHSENLPQESLKLQVGGGGGLSHYGRILLPQSGSVLEAFRFNKKKNYTGNEGLSF